MVSSAVFPSVLDRFLSDCSHELEDLEVLGLRRRPLVVDAVDGPTVRIGTQQLICWCSNDYLGLSAHPALANAAAAAAAEWGIGARASRLLAGTTVWHHRLEDALAVWFGTEAAIVYPSGTMTNAGTLGALLGPDDVVCIDRLAHASLLDAARHSRAKLQPFHHNDPHHVATLLARARFARRRLIVTEGVFSMDGDISPLVELVEVARAHDALVYLDDAHGAFVMGAQGRGTPELFGVSQEHLLYMGTLGKALGCQGGFVVGPRVLIEWLHQRARPFLYATALAVPVVAAAVEALRVLHDEPQWRQQLNDRVRYLHARLGPLQTSWAGPVAARPHPSSPRRTIAVVGCGRMGASAPRHPPGSFGMDSTHIVPIVVGQPQTALEVSQQLWAQGHWAPAIRPPTVPQGTSRLRMSVTALHTEAQIDSLAESLKRVKCVA